MESRMDQPTVIEKRLHLLHQELLGIQDRIGLNLVSVIKGVLLEEAFAGPVGDCTLQSSGTLAVVFYSS